MRITILISLFLFSGIISYGQDFDVYPRKQDDKVIMPKLNDIITVDEFQLLSREARMMDMFYSAVVPGLIHFKAKDKAMGYTLVGLRAASYAGFAVGYFKLKADGKNIWDEYNSTEDISDNNWSVNDYQNLAIASLSVMIATYLFDWIHGKYRLEKKQELIRYRYGIKMQAEANPFWPNKGSLTPTFSISYTF